MSATLCRQMLRDNACMAVNSPLPATETNIKNLMHYAKGKLVRGYSPQNVSEQPPQTLKQCKP